MTEKQQFGFSWEFIEEMTWWTLGISGAIALLVAIPTHDAAFALGCLVATVVDVVLVRVASSRAQGGLAEGRIDSAAPIIMTAGRLVAKAALLVLSLAVPELLGFAGTVVGVLAFDVTLALVGSIKAAARTMRHPREGG